ncbi:MAG: hypothetical protein IJS71_08305 [Clostridia bacterium]|nr:hypothetical protein [Clostridia bacterium]
MIVNVDIKKTADGKLFEDRLRELSKLTVRVGYQRGVAAYDAEEVEKFHEKQRKKQKKSKGASPMMAPDTKGEKARPGAVHAPGESRSDRRVDLLDVAMWNELGTVHSPSRPFLRMSVDENKDLITKRVAAFFKQFAMLKIDVFQLLSMLGNFQKGLIQKKIRDGKFVPNSPYTIAMKGSDKPLIDTGRMRQSVHYQIMTKDNAEQFDNESIT